MTKHYAASIYCGDFADNSEYFKIARNFRHMHDRCAKGTTYHKLGRKVCNKWNKTRAGYRNYKNWFLSEMDRLGITLDMLNNSYHQYTVDRIDNDLGYSPDNCRITNMKVQSRNRTNSPRFIGIHIYDWADALGVDYKTIRQAFNQGTLYQLIFPC